MSVQTNTRPAPDRLAALMHPHTQRMVVEEVRRENKTANTYTLKSTDGAELAYFHAGQYLPIFADIDGNQIERPYALCSSPEDSVNGFYQITVKKAVGGYVSTYIHESWEVGTEVTVGSPKGFEYYQPLRDAKKIIALAGGVGITPFRSMAKAILDGTLDCDLTLIYGANTYDEVMFRDEWKELEAASNGRFRYALVLANEEVEGAEHGFITLDMIRKYQEIEGASLFISGPAGLTRHLQKELAPLNLPKKSVRWGIGGDSGARPAQAPAAERYHFKVHQAGEIYEFDTESGETILKSLEKANLQPPALCRSGLCGWCRACLINGTVDLLPGENGIRKRDLELGYIHPCCSFPTSDLEIVVQRA